MSVLELSYEEIDEKKIVTEKVSDHNNQADAEILTEAVL